MSFGKKRKPKDDKEEAKRLHEECVEQEKKKEAARSKNLKEKNMHTAFP